MAASRRIDSVPPGRERRVHDRYAVKWSVDCETGDALLYASITNVSALGIFIHTQAPKAIGTHMVLRFAPPGHAGFQLRGEVTWVNSARAGVAEADVGMGIRFSEVSDRDRKRLMDLVHAIAYVG